MGQPPKDAAAAAGPASKADPSGKKKSKGARPKKSDAFVASHSTPDAKPATKKKKAAQQAAADGN